MKAVYSDSAPCKLARAHIRRVPQNKRSYVVGYHVCCPQCGFVTIALQGKDGLTITENLHTLQVSFSTSLRCVYCNVLIHLHDGEMNIEEDAHVRHLQYR
ncbi:MAG: hypothetical protein JXX14_18835 [Deltaproteobacteria bacterium]|nr:hypothetical protein [Deltaproteobacteria bacterium]